MEFDKKFKLRFMKADEVGRVAELVRGLQAYQKMKECPRLPDAKDFSRELTHQNQTGSWMGNNFGTFVVVAIDLTLLEQPNSAAIVGYLIYTQAYCILNGRHFYMNSFFIQEGYRHHGLGTKFMNFMQIHAKKVGNNRVDVPFMNDNFIGQKFYAKYGASSVKDEYEVLSININYSKKGKLV